MGGAVEFDDLEVSGSELAATIAVDGERIPVWVRASVPLSLERADALVPLGVLVAMRTRSRLVLPLPVSARLLANVRRAEEILRSFSGGALAVTPVDARPAIPAVVDGRGVGTFFSGGVDAFYTLRKHLDAVTHLVFLMSFDVRDATSRRAQVAEQIARDTAAELGKGIIEVDSNVREIAQRFAWREWAWGAAMATIALLLQDQLERIELPSSDSYGWLEPWGTHPLLDPLWSTEALAIHHDGCEATRVQKVEQIASWPIAMRNLRVCNKQHAKRNCGRCEKCLRTMMSLRLVGALERCKTLPDELDLRAMARLPMATDPNTIYTREHLVRAQEARDWPAAAALAWSLRPRPELRARHALGRLKRVLVQK